MNQNRIKKTFSVSLMVLVLILTFSLNVSANQTVEITEKEVVDLINQAREIEGLDILVENEKLTLAANQKAEDMLKENYFAHNSPSGKTPWFWIEKNNYDYRYAGENLAMDFHNAKDQHSAWMKSPTHKKNILNENFREIGIAIKQGFIEDHLAIITVQEFGTPMKFIPSYSSNKNPLPQVKALEKEKLDLKSVPVLDRDQLNNFSPKEGMLIIDWHSLVSLYLKTLIILIILTINPFIVALLIVQFINFKVENEKNLALKN